MDRKSGFDIFGKKQTLDSNQNISRQSYTNRNFYQPNEPNSLERNPNNYFNSNKIFTNNQNARRESNNNENYTNQNVEKIFQTNRNNKILNQNQQDFSNSNQRFDEYQSDGRFNQKHPKNFPNKLKNFDNLSQHQNFHQDSNDNFKHQQGYLRGFNKPYDKQNKQFHNRDPIDYYLNNIENREMSDMTEENSYEKAGSFVVPNKFKQRYDQYPNQPKDDNKTRPNLIVKEKKIEDKKTENIEQNISDDDDNKLKKNIKLRKNQKKFGSINKVEINQDDINDDSNLIVFKTDIKNNYEEMVETSNNKPKIKISLDKVNELEKKRKQLVKSLETTERERSLSPLKPVGESKSDLIVKNQTVKSTDIIEEPKKIDISKFAEGIQSLQKAKLMSMCSDKEIRDREEQNNMNILEIDPNTSFYEEQLKRYVIKINPEFAIKAFSRPAADTIMNDPENIRPPKIISKTIQYILDEIVDLDQDERKQKKYAKYTLYGENINFQDIALFVEDRLRAVRQDYTILNLKGNKNCIQDHEKIARFLILCLNECLDYSAFTGYQGLLKGIIQQLNATLTSLREFYEYVNDKIESMQENPSDECFVSPYQAEFYLYSILLSVKETTDLISMLNKIPNPIKNTKLVKLTKKIVRTIMGKEWLSFFKIIRSDECDYLLSCVMSLYFKDMRAAALEQISKSPFNKIKDSNYKTSINKLCDIFMFEDSEECINFLYWFGIDINENAIYDSDEKIELIRTDWEKEEATLPKKSNRRFIETKRKNLLRKDVISGNLEKYMSKESTPTKIESDAEKNKEIIQMPENKNEFKKVSFPTLEIPLNKPVTKREEEKVISKGIFSEKEQNLLRPATNDIFNIKPELNIKSVLTESTLITKPEAPSEVKLTETISNQKTLQNLNTIEEQFRKDLGAAIYNEKSIITDKTQHIKDITILKNKEYQTLSEISEIQEKTKLKINSFNNLEKKFKKLSFMRFFTFLKKAQTLSHYYDMKIKSFRFAKKMKIFKLMRRYVENILLNRHYIRELIKMKLDTISINNYLTLDTFKIENKNFFNYFDVRNMLINKFFEENQNELNESVNHLKIVIYTDKELFYSTSILQNLFSMSNDQLEENKIEIEEGKNFLNISENNKLEPNTKKYFSFFLNFVFIDQLNLQEIPMFIKDNLKAIDKFSTGLIYIDYSNCEIVEKLMIILEYANAKNKKEFYLMKYFRVNELSSFNIDTIVENMNNLRNIISEKETKEDYLFFPKYDFTSYYSDLVDYHNNREFFTFFENEIRVQKFSVKIICLEEYLTSTRLFTLLKRHQFNRKNNFLASSSGLIISESNWIKFFVDVRFNYLQF